MSSSLQPHGMQHTRLPCPSLSPRVCSNSCPLSWWCHPSISSLIAPSPPALKSFPASGSFPVSQIFISGGQSIGASASASFLPMNIQDWFPLGWLVGSSCSPRNSQKSPAPQLKSINSSVFSFLYSPTLTSIHDCGKTIALTIWIFVGKVVSLLFSTLSRFVTAFLPRSKHLLIRRSLNLFMWEIWCSLN